MNIYQHVEHAARELDSKLLIATIAAARGHQVVISDLEVIEKGIRRGVLTPGIFHTKSLTPGEAKIARHQAIIDNGSLISSIDEEAGLIEHGYDRWAKFRYSDHTIGQSTAVFSWGTEDADALKKFYPKHSAKIYKTGSPRVDLWKSLFYNYWELPRGVPKKPYLLVVSNMSYANYQKPFHSIISSNRKGGHFKRDPKLFIKNFEVAAEDYRKTAAFIEGVQHLTKHNNGYDIVLRPHPNENIESWKIYLEGVPNVHVIRVGSITAWVRNAFAVMHNSCTTALEATVSQKPLVTYIPFQQKHGYELPNGLGYCVKSKEELLNKVNSLFDEMKYDSTKKFEKSIPENVYKKIHLDEKELASEKMIKIWESLADNNNNLSRPNNWTRFKMFIMFMKFRGVIGRLLQKIFTKKFSQAGSKKENFKFDPFEQNDIIDRVNKLRHILGIKVRIDCKILSDRTILIKRN